MMKRQLCFQALRVAVAMLLSSVAFAATDSKVNFSYQTQKVADGVYAFISPTGGSFVSGNSILVVGKDAALVVDSGHFPTMTRSIVGEVKKLTDRPVRFLVNTHWHADHISGNSVYQEFFPNVAIISTDATRSVEARFPDQFDDVRQVSGTIPMLERTLSSGIGQDGKPLTQEARAETENLLKTCKQILPEFQSIKRVPPTVTFTKKMTVDLGGRLVDIEFLGRGNTIGDAVVYVRDVNVLATGDLVTSPVPYAFGAFVSEWIDVLQRVQGLHASVFIPGHGQPQHDSKYVELLSDTLKELKNQVQTAITRGDSDRKILSQIDLEKYQRELTGDDKKLAMEFRNYFVEPAAHRLIDELRGQPEQQ